jgi:hypothetical protein
MTTYTLADPSLAAHSGRTCHLSTTTGQTWRGTFIRSTPKPLSAPGCFVVAISQRGQLRKTPPLPGDTVITIYPKESA